ncbi:MAG: LPS assembly protein LptD [Candidatus Kaelpia aquatica]|nr:LPS assembly protein LptD [Candidatus Kaelpia aquatica]
MFFKSEQIDSKQIGFIVTLLLLLPFLARIGLSDEVKPKSPVTVNGDKVEYDPTRQVMVGEGNVEVISKGMKLYADKITVWLDEEKALAQGDVKFLKDDAVFYAEEISYSFKNNEGKIIEPTFKDYGPWYGKGLEAQEYEESKYLVKQAYMTTCDLEDPHYKLEAKTIKIFPEDKIIAKHVVFYVRNTPIFYLPYFKQSLKDKKAPFMIIPGKSDKWGWYLLGSYRYSLDDENEGLLRLDYREKKGIAHGVEHQYKSPVGDGVVKYYYMNEKDSAYQDNDRFRVSLRHSWNPDDRTSIYAEYNKISDIDFLKDYFEREHDEDSDPETYLYMIRRYSNANLSLNIKKRANHFLTEVERLPELGVDVNDLRIKKTNYYYSSNTFFSNLTKKYADSDIDYDVWRFDTYNELSHVKKYLGFLNFSPYLGVRETFYSKKVSGKEHILRGNLYAGFDSSMRFYKVFNPASGNFLFTQVDSVRHVVTPIFNYEYITEPTISRADLIQFDEVDEVERKSRITLTLENLWQTKSEVDEDIKKRDLFQADISAYYDCSIAEGSRWGEAKLELDYRPGDWFRFENDYNYDIKSGRLNTASFDVVIDKDRWQLSLGDRYERDTSAQFTTDFNYRINEKWKFRVYQRYEFQSSSFERQEFTIYRDLHCWDGKLSFINNNLDNDKAIFVVFTCKAFPEHPFSFSQSYSAGD